MATIPRKSLRDFAGLGVPGVMDDADVGADALAGERDVLEVVRAREGQIARRRLARADPRLKVALEPQAIIPPAILAPPDQIWCSVEAVAVQNHPRPSRPPSGHRGEQVTVAGNDAG